MATILNSKVPSGPLEKKWEKHREESKLVAPNNRRKFDIIVVGSGLAGAAAAATLGELGYNVKCFCFQDSPRRAHSIAAQGGINAAKNYQNDGDTSNTSGKEPKFRPLKGYEGPKAQALRLNSLWTNRSHRGSFRLALSEYCDQTYAAAPSPYTQLERDESSKYLKTTPSTCLSRGRNRLG
jgi:FAD binding domain